MSGVSLSVSPVQLQVWRSLRVCMRHGRTGMQGRVQMQRTHIGAARACSVVTTHVLG